MSKLTLGACNPLTTPSAIDNPLQWLKVNYTYHKISDLASRVGASIKETCAMLEQVGVDLNLTLEQEAFIREYYCEYSIKELATELAGGRDFGHLLITKIVGFIQKYGIKKTTAPIQTPVKRRVKRVPDQRQNEKHSDRIAFWNSLSDDYIKNHKGRIKY